jgi:SAM-dependent methyltransferase
MDRVLDRRLGTAVGAADPEPEHHPEWNAYLPTPWHVLPRALRYLGVTEQDTFVDFGCGKGRVLHQAAKRPFRRVVGIEISPVLADQARAALAAGSHRHRCRDVEIVVADAAEFPVPDDLTIAYFFHPFADETFAAVLQGLIDSIDRNPRAVRLIYVHPAHRDRVLATGRFRLLKEQRSRLLDTVLSQAAIFETV